MICVRKLHISLIFYDETFLHNIIISQMCKPKKENLIMFFPIKNQTVKKALEQDLFPPVKIFIWLVYRA